MCVRTWYTCVLCKLCFWNIGNIAVGFVCDTNKFMSVLLLNTVCCQYKAYSITVRVIRQECEWMQYRNGH
jgi:hypothetical protein